MGSITLLTGGARSGKSSFALELAKKCSGKRIFVATAIAFDEEMEKRIKKHKMEREKYFTTIEEPYDLKSALLKIEKADMVIVDCLTVWLGNLFYKHGSDYDAVEKEVRLFVDALGRFAFDVVMVTNEVGSGIVPDNPLGRTFRDVAGILNQSIGKRADVIYLCCRGVPLQIKGAKANEGV
jgi:adenosylcobinamide kinase/adenosylcobinamide-phosphate guanylyltransferase